MHAGRTLRRLAQLSSALAPFAAVSEPLDLNDPTPRGVLVEPEISSNLATVGQSFGAPLPATYSASGGTGTLVIPVASYETLRSGSLTPVPGSFTALVISIDLATGSATSQPASGAVISGPGQAAVFTQQALGTDTLAGFMDGSTGVPIFCTSQADVEAACQINPIPEICNATCVVVPGAPFDPVSGKLNLVGAEQRQLCGGTGCFGAHTAFSHFGDLRLSESAAVPVLPPLLAAALASLLAASAAVAIRRKVSA